MKSVIVCILLLTASTAICEERIFKEANPSPTTDIIGGEENIQIGDIVDLQVKPLTDKDTPKSVSYSWTVLPATNKIVVWPDGSRIVFGSGATPKKITVILTASYVYVKEENSKSEISQKQVTAMRVVTIGNAADKDVTDKDDPNQPGSILSAITKDTIAWVATVNEPQDQKRNKLLQLAESFRSVAQKIDNGELADIGEIFLITKNQNSKILGQNNQAWKPFGVKLSEKLKEIYDSGATDSKVYSQVWKEIAAGLELSSK